MYIERKKDPKFQKNTKNINGRNAGKGMVIE
jgi:hypothetical protein